MPKQLDQEVPGLPDVPSKVLIPRLLQLFTSNHVEAKSLAIGVTNLLAGAAPESLAPSLERCIVTPFAMHLTGEQMCVCKGIKRVQMLHIGPVPHVSDVVLNSFIAFSLCTSAYPAGPT